MTLSQAPCPLAQCLWSTPLTTHTNSVTQRQTSSEPRPVRCADTACWGWSWCQRPEDTESQTSLTWVPCPLLWGSELWAVPSALARAVLLECWSPAQPWLCPWLLSLMLDLSCHYGDTMLLTSWSPGCVWCWLPPSGLILVLTHGLTSWLDLGPALSARTCLVIAGLHLTQVTTAGPNLELHFWFDLRPSLSPWPRLLWGLGWPWLPSPSCPACAPQGLQDEALTVLPALPCSATWLLQGAFGPWWFLTLWAQPSPAPVQIQRAVRITARFCSISWCCPPFCWRDLKLWTLKYIHPWKHIWSSARSWNVTPLSSNVLLIHKLFSFVQL